MKDENEYDKINPKGEYHKGSEVFEWAGYIVLALWFKLKTFSYITLYSSLVIIM
jgi:hypothetical protein